MNVAYLLLLNIFLLQHQSCLLLVSVSHSKAQLSENSQVNNAQIEEQIKLNCVPFCTCVLKTQAHCKITTDTQNLNCLKEWKSLHITLQSSSVVENWFSFCQNIQNLDINNNKEMSVLDPTMFQGLSSLKALTVSQGVFRYISEDLMHYLPALTSLKFVDNLLETLEHPIFSTCPLKTIMDLSKNKLKYLKPFVFQNCSNLATLLLKGNLIRDLDRDTFTGLKSLTKLFLQNNQIEALAHEGFHLLSKLNHLHLGSNYIREIASTNFLGLNELKILSLEYNRIEIIHPEAFIMLYHLTDLNLKGNHLIYLHPRLFQHCKYLEKLDISTNRLEFLNNTMMAPLKALKNFNAEENAFRQIDDVIIKGMKSLKKIRVDKEVCFTFIPPHLKEQLKASSLCPIEKGHSNAEQSPASTTFHQNSHSPVNKAFINTKTDPSIKGNVSQENPMNDVTKLETLKSNQGNEKSKDQSSETYGSRKSPFLPPPAAALIHPTTDNSSWGHISIGMFIFSVVLLLFVSFTLILVIFLHFRCRRKYRRQLEAAIERNKKQKSNEHGNRNDNENENGDKPMSLHPLISTPSPSSCKV